MLVLVEGSDRAGKSTIVAEIRRKLLELYPSDRVDVMHAGPPNDHPLIEYEYSLQSYRPGHRHHIICDRWHVGESVYPAVLNRKTQLTQAMRTHIELFLRSRGALLVYVHAKPDELLRRLAEEEREHPGHSLVSADRLIATHERFYSEMSHSTMPVLGVDTTSMTPTDIADATRIIVQLAETADRDTRQLNTLTTYVGGPWPNALLIGDVRHVYRGMHRDSSVFDRAQLDPTPAFVPYPATSGAYLLHALTPLLETTDIGFINANDVDDPYFAWKALGEPVTVALGRHAYDTVKTWVNGAVPHPQFIRRFHNSHSSWYSTLIQCAAGGMNLLGARPTQRAVDAGTVIDDSDEEK